LAETLFAIHGRNEIQRFLPGEWKFREIGTATLDQTGQPIHDLVATHVESRFRPGCADAKRRVLAGTFARNLASIVAMAGTLAGMQIMARGHGCSNLCVPAHRLSAEMSEIINSVNEKSLSLINRLIL
jgi:hypothetical protein